MSQEPPAPDKTQSESKKPGVLKRFLGRIPFTKWFAQRVEERANEIFKKRMAAYSRLCSVDQELKDKYKSEFENGARQLAETDAWISEVRSHADILLFGLIFLTPIVVPILIARFALRLPDAQGHGLKWFGVELFVSLCTAFTAGIVLFLPAWPASQVSAKLEQLLNLSGFFYAWAAILFLVASFYDYRLYAHHLPVNFSTREWFYFINQAGISLPVMLSIATIYRLANNAMERRKQRLHTREVIADELLNILEQIDWERFGQPGSLWSRFWLRQYLAERLEKIASCIENNFPSYFPSEAAAMNRWTERSAAEMATGTREMIKGLVESGSNTTVSLKERVAKYFFAALAGDWGQFDRVPVEELEPREGVRGRLISGATALMTAAVPLLLLFLLRRWQLLSEPLLTYVTVGAYIWAALSLLSIVDPQYSGKIAALKDLTNSLPFGGKKDGKDGPA